jgi:hypothetical protein
MTSKNKKSANPALVTEPTTAAPSPYPFSPAKTEGAERPEIYLVFDGTGDIERDEFRHKVLLETTVVLLANYPEYFWGENLDGQPEPALLTKFIRFKSLESKPTSRFLRNHELEIVDVECPDWLPAMIKDDPDVQLMMEAAAAFYIA